MKILFALTLFLAPQFIHAKSIDTCGLFDVASSTMVYIDCDTKVAISSRSVAVSMYDRDFALKCANEKYKTYAKQIDDTTFDIGHIFDSRPDTDKFEYDVMGYENFTFLYQPIYTPEELEANNTMCPENVLGSYAVYYKDDKRKKAFHVFRPKLIDNDGKTEWAELRYEDGKFIVTCPKEWMDNAKYPVTLDPTFGKYTQGAFEWYSGGKGYSVSPIWFEATQDANIEYAYVYANTTSGNSNIRVMICNSDSGGGGTGSIVSGACSDIQTVTATPSWIKFNITASLTSGNYYRLILCSDALSIHLWYDTYPGHNMTYHTGNWWDYVPWSSSCDTQGRVNNSSNDKMASAYVQNPPYVRSVAVISTTTLRVYFSETVGLAAETTSNYTFSPESIVISSAAIRESSKVVQLSIKNFHFAGLNGNNDIVTLTANAANIGLETNRSTASFSVVAPAWAPSFIDDFNRPNNALVTSDTPIGTMYAKSADTNCFIGTTDTIKYTGEYSYIAMDNSVTAEQEVAKITRNAIGIGQNCYFRTYMYLRSGFYTGSTYREVWRIYTNQSNYIYLAWYPPNGWYLQCSSPYLGIRSNMDLKEETWYCIEIQPPNLQSGQSIKWWINGKAQPTTSTGDFSPASTWSYSDLGLSSSNDNTIQSACYDNWQISYAKNNIVPMSGLPWFDDMEPSGSAARGFYDTYISSVGGAAQTASNWMRGTPSSVGPAAAYSGSNCWGTNIAGNYSAVISTADLFTPCIDLRYSTAPVMTFWMYNKVQQGNDGMFVKISTDTGLNYEAIPSALCTPAYDGALSGGGGYSGSSAWGATDRTDWTQVTVDMAGYRSNPAVIRFCFGTNSGTADAGFYIDDIYVGEQAAVTEEKKRYNILILE